jgi:glycosyltransferase involved in cell wall biosynthesis
MLACAAAIHYTTGEERRLAEESLSTRRGVVVPLGVGEEFFSNDSPSAVSRPEDTDESYVVSLCRIHPKKGLELLIDAFSEVGGQAGLGHWRLVLAGDGESDYVDGLRKKVRQRGAEERVVFRGWVDGAERVSLIRNASLLALTSHQENFGLSVAESLACGVPVLVSEGVNLANDIRKYRAGWVTPLEGAAIRQTLREALEGFDERASRGRAGRKLASERFRWPTVARKLEKLYREVSGTRSSSPRALS